MSFEVKTAVVLGGAGLVGFQVARRIADEFAPARLVVVSLWQAEVADAVERLSGEVREGTEVVGLYGDVFVRGDLTPVDEEPGADAAVAGRGHEFEDTFGDFATAYEQSSLARLIEAFSPDVVVDSINTATAISYQDAFTASRGVHRQLELWKTEGQPREECREMTEKLLMQAAVPQLILHVRLLYQALRSVRCAMYLKIGTTGTGGMGLNIPFTHGEDKPSRKLMAKTAVAFAHTGLLFLLGRSPQPKEGGATIGTIIKELKPAAMIGFKDISFHTPRGKQFVVEEAGGRRRFVLKSRQPYVIYASAVEDLAEVHDKTPQVDRFARRKSDDGSDLHFQVPCVNTGENGQFARGEFETITHMDQMEMITPEDIAEVAVLEIRGASSGRDLIGAVDSAILGPSYTGGICRSFAIDALKELEKETGTPSVALGQLGPPQLSKYLYESHLFRVCFTNVSDVLAAVDSGRSAADLAERLFREVSSDDRLRDTITAIGIPVLHPSGTRIFRGPYISIPPFSPGQPALVDVTPDALDTWAKKGWVDLRPEHVQWWIDVFRDLKASAPDARMANSSARFDRRFYPYDEIRIGKLVAWIFCNRLEVPGYRIK